MNGICLRLNSSRCSISLLIETGSSAENISRDGNVSALKKNELSDQLKTVK